MNTQHTDIQLKQALAKMLPEKVKWTVSPPQYPDWCCLVWLNSTPTREVLDTELMHLCWLVEEGLGKQWNNYVVALAHVIAGADSPVKVSVPTSVLINATWQQRTLALTKVKGITI